MLVIGASGAIGSAAVQLASHHFGAGSQIYAAHRGMEYVKLGAVRALDYKEDFTKNGESYDLIIDVLGKELFSKYGGSLRQRIYMPVSFKTGKLLPDALRFNNRRKGVICALATRDRADHKIIREFYEGELKPVIDKKFPFEDAAEAHRYVEAGNKKRCGSDGVEQNERKTLSISKGHYNEGKRNKGSPQPGMAFNSQNCTHWREHSIRFFVPWILVPDLISPLPGTVQGQVNKAIDYGFDGMYGRSR
ncbi:MAG: zinc-binding dehydrogenase [Bacteroidales bacterium]